MPSSIDAILFEESNTREGGAMVNETNTPAEKPKPDKKLLITVITTAGDVKDNYPTEQPLQVVFDAALAKVGGESTPEQFTLEYGNEPLTDLARTIADYAAELGWEKKVELELVPAPEVV
jgi:hypothetical protein